MPRNRPAWEQFIKEAKVRVGLQCHPRRKRILPQSQKSGLAVEF